MSTNSPNTIGPETQINGRVTGSEPLHIEGHVEGEIELNNVLVIAPSGHVKAQVIAQEVVIEGTVEGKITAKDRVVLRTNSHTHGDLTTPRIVVEDGSVFNGNLYMTQPGGPSEN